MRGIIIAAGMGNRCRPHTQDTPKCLLEVGNTTLLDNVLGHFTELGIEKVAIVVGHSKQKIIDKLSKSSLDISFYHNNNYQNDNILHSLMNAKEFLQDDVVISYSDIWLEAAPLKELLATPGEIVLAVDNDWEKGYVGRTEHPVSEAEKVLYDENKQCFAFGKHLEQKHDKHQVGEFIGLFKMSAAFCKHFIATFNHLNSTLQKDSKFQFSVSWEKAYLTDFFNELVSKGHQLQCSLHKGGWQEMDTAQDYQLLLEKQMKREAYVI